MNFQPHDAPRGESELSASSTPIPMSGSDVPGANPWGRIALQSRTPLEIMSGISALTLSCVAGFVLAGGFTTAGSQSAPNAAAPGAALAESVAGTPQGSMAGGIPFGGSDPTTASSTDPAAMNTTDAAAPIEPTAPIPQSQPLPQPEPQSEPPATNNPAGGEPSTSDDPSRYMSAVELEVLRLTNVQRVRNGCPELQPNPLLTKAAKGHSAHMAKVGKMAHDGIGDGEAWDRVIETGYKAKLVAENVAAGQDSATIVVNEWMKSPDHRHNILNCNLKELGVGHVEVPTAPHEWNKLDSFWTQNFAIPSRVQ